MKKIGLVFSFCFLILFNAAAMNVSFKDGSAVVYADYFPTAASGDAVFVRLTFDFSAEKKFDDVAANMELHRNEKKIGNAKFYYIEKSDSKHELLCGIPLSTYLSKNDLYALKISYDFTGNVKNFTLPFNVTEKEFFEEVIPLNETNTAIRTDTSKERMNQIERLNKIYATTDVNGVHTTEPFITPVAANTRRSSFFGDRRTYVYSNGKKATSLHFGPDFAVPTGTNVICPAKGKVVMAENRISTGWSIVIEHLPGLYSIYYHMSKLDVEVGQMVSQGDLLGLSGATGMVTGPHLHWEVRLLAEAISPDFLVGKYIP